MNIPLGNVPFLKRTGVTGADENYPLDGPELILGRKSDAGIVVPSPLVSRHHARLTRREDGRYVITDLQSTHGTLVNGERVESHVLQHGDHIRLGRDPQEFLFLVREPETSGTWDDRPLEEPLRDLTRLLPVVPSESAYLEKLSCILDLRYELERSFSVDKTLHSLLHSALKISGAERGFILTRKDDRLDYLVGLTGDGETLSDSEFHASRSVTSQVEEKGEAIFMTEGLSADLARQESIVAQHLLAIACLPLRWISSRTNQLELQGILYLDSTRPMHTLSGLDQKILNKLAQETAQVFEKLEMIRTLNEQRQLEQELALAHETQKALLPAALPQLPQFQVFAYSNPTRYVGGDFYDFFSESDGHLAAVLADVSGKGVSAALLSSLIQGVLEMEFRRGDPLDRIVSRLNAYLCRKTQSNRFVTLFFFMLDPNGNGTYVNAGHNPIFLYRSADATIEELPSQGMILGFLPSACYEATPLVLHPEDLLFVYSDGVSEAMNPNGELFGDERLTAVIRNWAPSGAAVVQEKLLESLSAFTQDFPQNDDITFLVVQRKAPGG